MVEPLQQFLAAPWRATVEIIILAVALYYGYRYVRPSRGGRILIGMGIFLLAALAGKPFLRFMKRFRKHLGLVEKIIGVLLVITGVLFLTGSMNVIAYWILEAFPALGRIG